jgi:hypothetical protein
LNWAIWKVLYMLYPIDKIEVTPVIAAPSLLFSRGRCYKRFMSDIVWVYTKNLWVLTKFNAMNILYQSRLITHKNESHKDFLSVWTHIPWKIFCESTFTLKKYINFMSGLNWLNYYIPEYNLFNIQKTNIAEQLTFS